jgi:hypothetical protein
MRRSIFDGPPYYFIMAYISITGLRLNSMFHAPRFWWHAVRSMMQSQAAPGNISAETRTINGVHHTLTVWESKEAMRAYLVAGAHLKAMKSFKAIATGKVLGFEAEHAPHWDEVHGLWKTKGREV